MTVANEQSPGAPGCTLESNVRRWGVDARDDRTLLLAWREGDRHAGGELLRRHFVTLSRFFRYRVGVDPADLIQRTLLGCVESRERVPDDVPFRVYLLGVARRVLLKYFREYGRAAKHDGERVDGLIDTDPSGGQAMVLCQEQRLLLRALRTLSLDLQLTLELHYWERLKVREIAVVLGIAEGTVKYRLSHARRQLRERIAVLDPSPELVASTLARLDDWAAGVRRKLPQYDVDSTARSG